jgi:subtilisin family serine protease
MTVKFRITDGPSEILPWLRRAAVTMSMVGVLSAAGGVPIRPVERREPRPPSGREVTFRDLGEAARAGAIDSGLVETLAAGRPVDALVLLDGDRFAAAYADGSAAGIDRATSVVREMGLEDGDLEQGRGRSGDLQVLRTYDLLPAKLVRIYSASLALELLNRPSVWSITENRQHHHWLTASLPAVNQPPVAAMGLTGRGTSVAVLDTGVDFTRAEFGACTGPGAPAATCRVPVAFDTPSDDGSMDDDGHGTNVAAIVAGVAPGAQVIAIDVFSGSVAWDSDILAGIGWVMKHWQTHRVRAVNMSLGEPTSYHTNRCGDGGFWRNPYGVPLGSLRQAGVLTVVAAGNDAVRGGAFRDGVSYPACSPGAVVVGASYSRSIASMTWGTGKDTCTDVSTSVGSMACFSQDAPYVDVVAPGAGITAGGSAMGGTSQATPHVSGAIAVLAGARPNATGAQLLSFLTTSSTAVGDPRTGRLHPLLDLLRAVRAAVPVGNDLRAAATTLMGWGGQLAQTTWGATKDPGEPAHGGNSGGSSVWFRWTATRTGMAFFSTFGSDFDTLLAAYREAPGGGLVPLASNNDIAGRTTSLIQFPVAVGDTVVVAADGLLGAAPGSFPGSGTLRLAWNLPNDPIADALPIVPGVSVEGANIGATHEFGELHHCGDTYSTASVWYRWTPSAPATARIRAKGTPICVNVYRSPAGVLPSSPTAGAIAAVKYGGDYDAPRPIDFTFAASPADTYWIAVDGLSFESNCNMVTGQCWYTTATGPFTLDLTV